MRIDEKRFERWLPLIGQKGLTRLQNANVLIVGVGGVGSFVVEALARSGIGTLILIDGDTVQPSDLNRQLPALTSTLGMYKVDVLKARIEDINPQCEVIIHKAFYTKNATSLWLEKLDFVVDAIDDLPHKLDIIVQCKERNIPFITICGQGNRMYPEKITIQELSDTSYDPIAKYLRIHLRKIGHLKHTPCVVSLENPRKREGVSQPASNAFVPATAGLIAAGYVVRRLLEE